MDLISRQAAIEALEEPCKVSDTWTDEYAVGERMQWEKDVKALNSLPSAQLEQRWIPVKLRPMDSEEREYWEDQFGVELADEDAVMFDCPMPEDGQHILVSYRKWISTDKCEIDDGCYGLEENGDWEGVIAWMPLPEPYKEGEQE